VENGMSMSRAYALLDIKAVNDQEWVIEGIASTPTPDRVGDIVEPMGAKFALPLPLLWQHNSDEPIGHVEFAKPTKDGIPFRARIIRPETVTSAELKERLQLAWDSMKSKLVRFVSIGFRVLEYSILEDGGWRIAKWEWLELSPVTIPAQSEAVITGLKKLDAAAIRQLKKFDQGAAAPSGTPSRLANTRPPVSGKSITITKNRPKEGLTNMAKDVGAQIAALKEQRKEKAAALEAIQTKASGEGRTKTAEERTEFDTLRDELNALDAEIADLEDIEKLYAPTVKAAVNKSGDSVERPRVYAEAKKKEAPGIRFARLAKIKAISRMDILPELVVAEKMYGRDSEAYNIIKTGEVAPGSTVSGNWGEALVGAESGPVADFAEYLHEATILGKFGSNGIPSLRQVSFRSPLLIQTDDGDGYWVGESKPKPLTTFDFDRNTLTPLKCANIAVLSMEHIRDSSPKSDIIVRDALRSALVKVQDVAFIDPANSGSAGVRPASITSGAPAIVTEGPDYDDADTDIRSIIQKFINANNALSSGVWIMSEKNALALAMLRNDLGQPVFTGISMRGGTLMEMPVITSAHVGTNVVLLNAQDIHYGDDGDVTVDMSREASLEMKVGGGPTEGNENQNMIQNPLAPGVGTSLVSLWQNNLVGLLAEKTVNWRRRRPVSVAYLTGVAWGGAINIS
jgi:hypothetical protein